MIPTTPLPRNALLDLDPGIGNVRSSVRYELLDRTGALIGLVHPDVSSTVPMITNNAYGRWPRTLRNLTIPGYEANNVDTYTMRVRPVWMLEDGTEWPLGVFVWERPDRVYRSWDSPMSSTLVDLSYALDQSSPMSVGLSNGSIVTDVIKDLWVDAGFNDFEVQSSDVTVGEAVGWPSSTTWLDMITRLHEIVGYPPPWFTNEGKGISAPLPPLRDGQNVCRYVIEGTASRVYEGTVTISPDQDNAGAVKVIGSGATKGDVVGIAYVDPSLPWSRERRGFLTVKEIRRQGVSTTEQAETIAEAELDMQTSGAVQFDSPPDPRQDTHNIMEFGTVGDLYREISSTLTCAPAGPHSHTIVKGSNR